MDEFLGTKTLPRLGPQVMSLDIFPNLLDRIVDYTRPCHEFKLLILLLHRLSNDLKEIKRSQIFIISSNLDSSQTGS